MNTVMPIFNSARFSFYKPTMTFGAELSALGFAPGDVPKAFMMTSQWTGRDVIFDYQRTAEGEETDGEFSMYVYTARSTRPMTACLYND